jgi:hypothetical protein
MIKKLSSSFFLSSISFLLPTQFALAQIAYNIRNPLGEGATIEGVIVAILNAFIIIAIPIIILMIIYSGFLYVTARGNAEQTKKATTALTYAIIGGVIIIAATALAEIIKGLVDSFRS